MCDRPVGELISYFYVSDPHWASINLGIVLCKKCAGTIRVEQNAFGRKVGLADEAEVSATFLALAYLSLLKLRFINKCLSTNLNLHSY